MRITYRELGGTMVIVALLLPIFPEAREPIQWKTEAFNSRKLELETLGEDLKKIEPETGKTFNLGVRYGESSIRRSVVGITVGSAKEKKHLFGVLLPDGCAHVEYEGDKCWIHPESYTEFVQWANIRIKNGSYGK